MAILNPRSTFEEIIKKTLQLPEFLRQEVVSYMDELTDQFTTRDDAQQAAESAFVLTMDEAQENALLERIQNLDRHPERTISAPDFLTQANNTYGIPA